MENNEMNETTISTMNILNEQPFGITFTWKRKSVKIELVNGDDLLKIPELLSIYLSKVNIEHTIKKEKL